MGDGEGEGRVENNSLSIFQIFFYAANTLLRPRCPAH